jgi:hypothetical protein
MQCRLTESFVHCIVSLPLWQTFDDLLHWRCSQVASSAFVALTRLGCGGFVSGYRSGLPKDDGGYGITRIAGK